MGLSLVSLLALALTSCSGNTAGPSPTGDGSPATPSASPDDPSAATTFRVLIDAPSPEEPSLGFSQYFPASLRVHPGDTITYVNQGTINPHTVTFGVELDRSNQPVVPDGGVSPKDALIVYGPCRLPEASTVDLLECPEEGVVAQPWLLPDYDGTGFWHTGFITGEVDVTIDPSTPPGTYPFVCYLHPPAMNGVLEVIAPDEPADTPAEVASRGADAQAAALAGGDRGLAAPEAEGVTVAAGWGNEVVIVNEFGPADPTVPAGAPVTFHVFWYGHEVTFDDTSLSSPELDAGESFTFTFDDPGTYPFHCIHHVGMTGVLTVT